MGENSLRDSLWTPHIFIANERSSTILGTSEKDVLTSVAPDGTIILSQRIQATLHCWMNLQKFPFDEQKCKTVFESCEYFCGRSREKWLFALKKCPIFGNSRKSIFSWKNWSFIRQIEHFRGQFLLRTVKLIVYWTEIFLGMYNTSEFELHWEERSPITLAPELHLTEYVLLNMWTNETVINADLSDLRHGAFGTYYSFIHTLRNWSPFFFARIKPTMNIPNTLHSPCYHQNYIRYFS